MPIIKVEGTGRSTALSWFYSPPTGDPMRRRGRAPELFWARRDTSVNNYTPRYTYEPKLRSRQLEFLSGNFYYQAAAPPVWLLRNVAKEMGWEVDSPQEEILTAPEGSATLADFGDKLGDVKVDRQLNDVYICLGGALDEFDGTKAGDGCRHPFRIWYWDGPRVGSSYLKELERYHATGVTVGEALLVR